MASGTVREFDPETFPLDKYIEKLSTSDPRTGIGPLRKMTVEPFDPRALLGHGAREIVRLFAESVDGRGFGLAGS
jgi:hypothetical protein